MKKPLIVIGGPTACGKTGFSIRLAKEIGGEVISADSMQIYRYMDIGTAKVTPEEADGVPHYLIDELNPDEEYNVMLFQQKAKAYMEEIWAKGRIPILVGGTGFYINALLYDNDFTETENDTSYREECYRIAKEEGPQVLYERLRKIDPAYAETIHANNVKRVWIGKVRNSAIFSCLPPFMGNISKNYASLFSRTGRIRNKKLSPSSGTTFIGAKGPLIKRFT